MKKYSRRIMKIVLGVIFAYLIILVGGFFGIKKGLTNTAGIVDDQSSAYEEVSQENPVLDESPKDVVEEKTDLEKKQIVCRIMVVGEEAPVNAEHIAQTYVKTDSVGLVRKMLFAVQLRFSDRPEFADRMAQCEQGTNVSLDSLVEKYRDSIGKNAFPWMNDEEWQAINTATRKDKEVINRVAAEAQLPPRLIVSNLIVEQLRLFHAQRELFKKVFEPLKILGNATKISLGVMGVKEATAIAIEDHLHDPTSEYYLGQAWENKLNFSTNNPTQERFERLTREKDHYYSYLYAAIYLKEMMAQWERAGYDIKYRPEIIGTLFNVGFPQSKPKAEPKVGGSAIGIGEAKYSFGSLAYEFYYSGEMIEEFPYVTN